MEARYDNVTLIGLGGGGGKIVRQLAQTYAGRWIQLAYLDSDVGDLDYVDGVLHLPLGDEWAHGHGCGGDPILGEHATQASLGDIRELVMAADLLIVVGCLGGGTGSGGVNVVARLAHELDVMSFFFVTLPMAAKGNLPRQVAETALDNLRGTADLVIAVHNDLLFHCLPADTPTADAFRLANQHIAQALIGLAEIIRCRGIMPIDFASLKNILKHKSAVCALGTGHGHGDGRIETAIEEVFDSPLLGGGEFVGKADVVVATLVAGADFPIGDLTRCFTLLNERLAPSTQSVMGANLAPEKGHDLQLTLLAVQYPPEPTPGPPPSSASSSRPRRSRKRRNPLDTTRQFRLPFAEESGSLGIFANATATNYLGENLDIPTFQRRGVKIDSGT